MKADVIPVSAKLDIPSWVPDLITQSVSARYAAAVDRVYTAAAEVCGYCEVMFECFVRTWPYHCTLSAAGM